MDIQTVTQNFFYLFSLKWHQNLSLHWMYSWFWKKLVTFPNDTERIINKHCVLIIQEDCHGYEPTRTGSGYHVKWFMVNFILLKIMVMIKMSFSLTLMLPRKNRVMKIKGIWCSIRWSFQPSSKVVGFTSYLSTNAINAYHL